MSENRTELLQNPYLQELFAALASADGEERKTLMNQIAREFVEEARFLAIVQMDDDAVEQKDDNTVVFKEGAKISFVVITLPSGEVFYPAFSDWQQLGRSPWGNTEVKTLVLSFDDYWALIRDKDAGVVIDPYSNNLAFDKETMRRFHEIREMQQKGSTEHVVEKDTPVKIGDPAVEPVRLKKALEACALQHKEITAMWLKLMIKEEEKSWLLIVDQSGERKPLFDALGRAAGSYLEDGMYLDMVPYSDSFGQQAASGQPFYRKKKSLFSFVR